MHEFSLLKGIMKKLDQIAQEQQLDHIEQVKVRIGALAHISAEHFREHFEHAARDGVAENATLDIVEMTDKEHPQAQEIILESVQVPHCDQSTPSIVT